MISRSTTGWLPIDIEVDLEPAVVQDAFVRWMEFGSTPLEEPFMRNTVDRLRKEVPSAREIETDLDTLIRAGGRLPAIRPAGFIFHISHCGSTLIANALKVVERALIVSESRAVSGSLRLASPSTGPYLTARWDGLRRTILNSLFSLFAHYRIGEPEPLVLKFVSIDTLNMRAIRSYWPDVPCVMVIRDPVEVMVTGMKKSGWMTLKDSPEAASILFGWNGLPRSPVEMTSEEFCARALGSFYKSAIEAIDGRTCMVVDYVDLNPSKMREIGDLFGLPLPADEREWVDQVFGLYAKDPEKKIRFSDDRERKQKVAGMLVRSAANEWAMPAYAELRNRRLRASR